MNRIKIILSKHVDRDIIDAAIDVPGPFIIDVVNDFAPDAVAEYSVDAAGFDSDYLEALQKVVDKLTFPIEENAFVWKISRDNHTYSTAASYFRDNLSTGGTLTAVPAGTSLIMRIEIPGFTSNTTIDIDLWYNMEFAPLQIDALTALGIGLSGNGKDFNLYNTVPCKISFVRPEPETTLYVFDYDFNGQIITP